jgi:hypothetical protein
MITDANNTFADALTAVGWTVATTEVVLNSSSVDHQVGTDNLFQGVGATPVFCVLATASFSPAPGSSWP